MREQAHTRSDRIQSDARRRNLRVVRLVASDQQPPGPGVDAQGRSVIDPTVNVLNVVSSAVARLDDIAAIRAGYEATIDSIRDKHDHELRKAEAARIDAILKANADQVQRSAEVQAQTAITLAQQVVNSAEALRVQVEQTRIQNATALTAEVDPLKKDIADLRQVQYETAGGKVQSKESAVDSRSATGLMIAAGALASSVTLGIAGVAITLLLRGG